MKLLTITRHLCTCHQLYTHTSVHACMLPVTCTVADCPQHTDTEHIHGYIAVAIYIHIVVYIQFSLFCLCKTDTYKPVQQYHSSRPSICSRAHVATSHNYIQHLAISSSTQRIDTWIALTKITDDNTVVGIPYTQNFRMAKFSKKIRCQQFQKRSAVSNFENIIFENGARVQLVVIVVQLFRNFILKTPRSFQNFCKFSHLKISIRYT